MRLRLVIVPAVVAAAFGAGCSLITSYDGFTGSAAEDATVGDAAPTPYQTLCSPDIPPHPSVGKPTITNPLTYTGVVSQLRFIGDDPNCPLGKNLDGLDTCPGPAACAVLGQDAAVDADVPCDGEGGIDDLAQNTLLNASFNGSMKVDLATELPADLAAQRTGFVLTLSGYGGELNNPQVNVSYYNDVGTADGGTITDQAAVSHGIIVNQASSAYVTNGVLVAHFDAPAIGGDGGLEKVPLHFSAMLDNVPGISSFYIPLSSATLIGIPVLDPSGGLTMKDAQLVGRLKSDDLVAQFTAFFSCLDSADALIVCSQFDLTDSPATDGKGPICDAISIAVGFDMVPTVIVGSGPAIPAVNFCTANGFPVATNLCGTDPTPAPDPVPVDAGDDASGDDDAAL